MLRKALPVALLLILLALASFAGNIGKEDRRVLNRFWQYATRQHLLDKPVAARIPLIARFFLGTPYAGGTLETPADIKAEDLPVVNLRAFDCVTFVENVLALAYLQHYGPRAESAFIDNLRRIRYRDATILGYSSRLHYSSDWLHEMSRQHLLTDITRFAGGIPYTKTVSFMTRNAHRYPVLKASPSELARMRAIEDSINARPHYYIPKDSLHLAASRIREGDIILITTTLKGLDTSHLGIAVKRDGQTYLLHASSAGKRVMLTATPLSAYMASIPSQSGIILARARRTP